MKALHLFFTNVTRCGPLTSVRCGPSPILACSISRSAAASPSSTSPTAAYVIPLDTCQVLDASRSTFAAVLKKPKIFADFGRGDCANFAVVARTREVEPVQLSEHGAAPRVRCPSELSGPARARHQSPAPQRQLPRHSTADRPHRAACAQCHRRVLHDRAQVPDWPARARSLAEPRRQRRRAQSARRAVLFARVELESRRERHRCRTRGRAAREHVRIEFAVTRVKRLILGYDTTDSWSRWTLLSVRWPRPLSSATLSRR